jgi:DNA helicase-4
MVDVSTLLTLVTSATVVVVIIYYAFQTKTRTRLRENLLKVKNDILQAEKEFVSLYNSPRYFSKRDMHLWKQRWSHIAQLVEQCVRKRNLDLDFQNSITTVADVYQKGERLLEKRNAAFIEKEIVAFKDFFDSVESYPLTTGQRRAIVIDEHSSLVIAGAGTGKTSTIIGKAGYLIKKGLAAPEEILLIAFNRDIVSEMDERVYSRLGIRLNVRTFHSLGLDIIAESEGVKPSVSELVGDRVKLPKKILEFIKTRMEDESFSKLVNEYSLFHFSPYKSVFEFGSYGEYIEYLKRFDIRSLKGDRVKSFEECDIANFLYANGIDYAYEKPYEVKTADMGHQQYKPDFFLPKYGIYIEHFGIDREGRTAPYISPIRYNEEMKWKRDIHREHKTTLVETYSYERQEGKLLSNLEEKLRKRGVAFNPIPSEQLFNELNELGKVSPFALLLSTFLNLFKSCGKTLDELRNHVDAGDTRTRMFLDIFSKVYEDYTSYLQKTDEIDFNDMINMATSYARQKEQLSKFKYILVDEFQDISESRYRFLKSMLYQNSAKLFCVGDDWQSIYRFTGSDLSIMLDFEARFEFCDRSFLEETFRLNDKLCDFSTKFILQNPNQIEKKITSQKRVQKPAVTIIKGKTENALAEIIHEINQRTEGKESIFIIGRYNYLEPKNLYEMAERYPKLMIRYTTAHSSKGLEADYVTIIGLRSGELGFPCQITDDPILNLVLAREDLTANAEERRLFYVSITRARKHVYLVVDDRHGTSTFASEIQRDGYEINVARNNGEDPSCPLCETGKIVLRKGKYGEFHSCSNYPYCEYKER